MSDDFDEAAFRAGFPGAAEAPAPADTAVVEEPEPARDEKGKFVAVDKTDSPEETVEEAQALLAGKYKTPQELEQAYTSLQAKMGEQGAELGGLRSLRETMEALQAEIAQANNPAPVYQPDEVEAWLQENPTRIPEVAVNAFKTGQEALMDQAIAAWEDVDPAGARRFSRAVAVEQAKQALTEEFGPQLGQVQQQAQNNEFANAFSSLETKYADFGTVLKSVTEETIAGFPRSSLALLQNGTLESKTEVLETLYRWQKAEQAGTLTEAAKAATVQAQEETQAARANATVASATTSPSREEGNPVDLWRQGFRDSPEFKKSAGLN